MEKLLFILLLFGLGLHANAQSVNLCPDNNHPHMIDLGLPSGTKWACCNVGASKPEGYGGYYAWGETNVKKVYDWSTYKHCDGSKSNCHDIGDDIAGTKYDVAHVKWGANWHMPSYDQIVELKYECRIELVVLNNINCYKFTGPNGVSIYFPAAGIREDAKLNEVGANACIWSSELEEGSDNMASGYNTKSSRSFYRNSGLPIRPVVGSKAKPKVQQDEPKRVGTPVGAFMPF